MTRPHETDNDRRQWHDDTLTAPGGVVVGLLSTTDEIDEVGLVRFTSGRAEFHCNWTDVVAAALAAKQTVSIAAKIVTENYRIVNIEGPDDAGGARLEIHKAG